MREQIVSRLNSLKSEYEKGQVQLQQLQGQLSSLRDSMLRIDGAITVLDEILSFQGRAQTVEQGLLQSVQADSKASAA